VTESQLNSTHTRNSNTLQIASTIQDTLHYVLKTTAKP